MVRKNKGRCLPKTVVKTFVECSQLANHPSISALRGCASGVSKTNKGVKKMITSRNKFRELVRSC